MRRLPFVLKKIVAGAIRRHGYRIQRDLDFGEDKLDIFDLALRDLLRSVADPFFVQVGANDGLGDDPLRPYVERYRWRGLLVEPLPSAFARLRQNYCHHPQLVFEQAAIARTDGDVNLYTPAEGGESASLLGSLSEGVLRGRIGHRSKVTTTRVPAMTLQSLFAKHRLPRVDILQVDAEGYDFEVIRMLDDSGLDLPPLIRFESMNLSDGDRAECLAFLGARGYRSAQDEIDVVAYRYRPG